MNDDDVVKLFKKQRTRSKRGLSVQYDNTDACRSFYNADVMNYQDKIQFTDTMGRRRRVMVNFNKVQPSIDAVIGFFAQNRRVAKYSAHMPQNQEQGLYSKNMNAIADYHRDNTNADQIETDQDADMIVNGYGAIDTDLSYLTGNATKDPNGEILKTRLDPMKVYWDPVCKNKNLIGARWCGYYEDFELRDALDLFQDSDKKDFQPVSDDNGTSSDAGYIYNPWGGLYDKIKFTDNVEWTSREEDLVRVYNHQWMQYETFYRAKNPLYLTDIPEDAMFIKMRLDVMAKDIKSTTAYNDIKVSDMFDFDPSQEELVFDEETKRKLVREFGELIKPQGFKRECYYTAVISGSHVFKWFKSISQQGYSLKFKTGIYNENGKYWVGMTNAMMEPQKYYNKALTEFMFIVAANSKGGVMIEEGAVEDIADFESKYSKTDAVIKVMDGALSGGKIQAKAAPAIPTGLDSIMALSDQVISSVGVDPSFMGSIQREDQSGVMYKRRIRQVISKFARYADSITLYQKEDARLMADLIRVWMENNNGKWIRITGEDGADEFLQLAQDILAPEYSVSIQEAPQTPEDKEETGSSIQSLGDKLAMIDPNAARSLWAESLQFYPIDNDVRNRITQILQPNNDMVPAQQLEQLQNVINQLQGQVSQLQMSKTQSEVEYNKAKTAKEMADAQRTVLENNLVQQGQFQTPTISI